MPLARAYTDGPSINHKTAIYQVPKCIPDLIIPKSEGGRGEVLNPFLLAQLYGQGGNWYSLLRWFNIVAAKVWKNLLALDTKKDNPQVSNYPWINIANLYPVITHTPVRQCKQRLQILQEYYSQAME